MAIDTLEERIAAKKQALDALRPLHRRNLENLSRWYDVELTYSSNAIEGNTLTRSETAIVIEKGITVNGKSLREHMEVIGHIDALNYVRVLAEQHEPIREIDIREIHRLVMHRVDPEEAGRYSKFPRMISGSALALPSPSEIIPLMSDLGQWLATSTHDFDSAFSAHERLITIHPFSDGNGRTARLLMNLILFKAGYPPIVIGPEERLEYIAALESYQMHQDAQPYRHFMMKRLEASLDHYLSILQQPTSNG